MQDWKRAEHLGNCDVEAKDDGYSSCTCNRIGRARRRAADRIYIELKRQGPNTMTITDIEADWIARLLTGEV